jgi:hypothetical protein
MPKPTPKKTAPPVPPPPDDDAVAGVDLDLDALERDTEDRGVFVVRVKSTDYRFLDPQDIEWTGLLGALTNPAQFFHHCLSEEQTAAFLKEKIPTWKMEKLMKGYAEFFGMPSAGEASALP